MPDLLFGDVLRKHCDSPSHLAREVNIERALASRYLNNKAVPKLKSEVIERIVKQFNLSEEEREELEAAQIASLRNGLRYRPQPRSPGKEADDLLRQANFGTVPQSRPLPYSDFDRGVIANQRAMLEEAIRILEGLKSPAEGEPNNIIRITFLGQSAFEGLDKLHEQWIAAQYEALKQGWGIQEVWRLDKSSVRRSIHLIESVLPLLRRGRFEPFCHREYGLLRPPYSLLVIPKQSAILSFATNNPDHANAGVVFKYAEMIDLLVGHFDQLLALCEPALVRYQPAQREQFLDPLAEAEATHPGRYMVRPGLTLLTKPPSWFEPGSFWIQAAEAAGNDGPDAIRRYRGLMEKFEASIASHKYQDICPKQAIVDLVADGTYYNDIVAADFETPPEKRREHLDYAIQALKTYDNYELALLDPEEEETIPTNALWAITGEARMFLELREEKPAEPEMNPVSLEIREPTIVRAFRGHFHDLWKTIKPRNRDKEYVIWWLSRQLETLDSK